MSNLSTLAVMEELRKYLPEMTLVEAMVFLIVATDRSGYLTVQDIQKKLGLTQPSATRNIQTFLKLNRFKRPGLAWIKSEADPMNQRYKLLTLTPAGKRVAEELEKLSER